MKETEVQRGKYKGWTHDEIIQHQKQDLQNVMKGSSGSIDLNLSEPLEHEKINYEEIIKREEIIRGINRRATQTSRQKNKKLDKGGNAKPIETKIDAYETRLTIDRFKLGGLGESGKGCGEVIASEIDIGEEEDGIYGIRYHPVDCLRIQCPRCYVRWAIERTFAIVMRIEAMALIRGERPFHVIYSVPPRDCEGWTWTNVNNRLWKRGVRHLKRVRCKDVGKKGHKIKNCPKCKDLSINEYAGIGIFHPLRVREKWKRRWGADPDPDDFEDLADSGKFWKKIRYSIANGLGALPEYAKLGFHCHNWVFNDHPHKHKDPEFVVRYLERDGSFKRFSRKEVVAFTRYLLTHTCVINEKTTYMAHQCGHCGHIVRGGYITCSKCGRGEVKRVEVVRNRIVHPVRSYGMLLNFKPKQELIKHFGEQKGKLLYDLLAKEICSYLVLEEKKDEEDITLGWDAEAGEIFYPAYHGSSAPAEGENWVSVWKVFDLLLDDEFLSHLTEEEYDFLEDLADYMRVNGKPPPLKLSSHVPCAEMFYVPRSVSVDAPEGNGDDIFYGLSDFKLQDDILRLINNGENDIWRLDVCLAEYSLGDILEVINRLVGMGVVQDRNGDLSLCYADWIHRKPAPTPRREETETKKLVSDVSRKIVRLIGDGITDYDFLRSHFPSVPTYRFSAVMDKLLESGAVIQNPNGELVLGGRK